MNTLEEIAKICPFPIGHENIEYEQYFAGKSYLYPLSSEQVSIANVTFEPDCRNHWHIHHGGGQILLCTAGNGYYQEWGKDIVTSCRRCRKYTSRSKALAWSNKK